MVEKVRSQYTDQHLMHERLNCPAAFALTVATPPTEEVIKSSLKQVPPLLLLSHQRSGQVIIEKSASSKQSSDLSYHRSLMYVTLILFHVHN